MKWLSYRDGKIRDCYRPWGVTHYRNIPLSGAIISPMISWFFKGFVPQRLLSLSCFLWGAYMRRVRKNIWEKIGLCKFCAKKPIVWGYLHGTRNSPEYNCLCESHAKFYLLAMGSISPRLITDIEAYNRATGYKLDQETLIQHPWGEYEYRGEGFCLLQEKGGAT